MTDLEPPTDPKEGIISQTLETQLDFTARTLSDLIVFIRSNFPLASKFTDKFGATIEMGDLTRRIKRLEDLTKSIENEQEAREQARIFILEHIPEIGNLRDICTQAFEISVTASRAEEQARSERREQERITEEAKIEERRSKELGILDIEVELDRIYNDVMKNERWQTRDLIDTIRRSGLFEIVSTTDIILGRGNYVGDPEDVRMVLEESREIPEFLLIKQKNPASELVWIVPSHAVIFGDIRVAPWLRALYYGCNDVRFLVFKKLLVPTRVKKDGDSWRIEKKGMMILGGKEDEARKEHLKLYALATEKLAERERSEGDISTLEAVELQAPISKISNLTEAEARKMITEEDINAELFAIYTQDMGFDEETARIMVAARNVDHRKKIFDSVLKELTGK